MEPRTLLLPLVLAAPALAQSPRYTAELLGSALDVRDMNAHGAVVGTALKGTTRAYYAAPGGRYDILPLPAGFTTSAAYGVNDAGVVVGAMAAAAPPEQGVAVAWTPDRNGGWTPSPLGMLPTHKYSVAVDVNDRGQIVGTSTAAGGLVEATVWFDAPGGLLDISALGAPGSPRRLSEAGVVVGRKGGLFDLDTLRATPLPALPPTWVGFEGWAVNELGELAGTARLGHARYAAALWTKTAGWVALGGPFGSPVPVRAFDLSDAGLAYVELPGASAYLPGQGTFGLEELLLPARAAEWVFSADVGGAVGADGAFATVGLHLPTGMSGAVLLRPVTCKTPQSFCGSKPNSTGEVARMGWTGVPSVGENAFGLRATHAVPGSSALFYYGSETAEVPFGDGLRCVGGATHRLPVVRLDATGAADQPLDLRGLGAGTTLHFQLWFRDANGAGGTGFNFSDGLSVSFCE